MPDTPANKKILFIDHAPENWGGQRISLEEELGYKSDTLLPDEATLKNSRGYDAIILEPYGFSDETQTPFPKDILSFFKKLNKLCPVVVASVYEDWEIKDCGLHQNVHFREYIPKPIGGYDLGRRLQDIL